MRLLFLLVLAFLAPLSSTHACLWDSDTLAAEAKGLPGTLEIITGRFERNPPLFYEMRFKRVTQEIKTQPNKLELYDDAGVACDRLHKGHEAIAWMTKKRAQLKPFPQDKEHWYRYHANLGTFQAHRWLRNGADRKKIAEMKTARDNIKRAIEINPDAHFGREKYQLMAMEWIIKPPKAEFSKGKTQWFSSFISYENLNDKNLSEAVNGLCGLVVLGNAWESVDVFDALAFVLGVRHDTTLAYAAQLRYEELVRNGKKSLFPKAPDGDALLNILNSRSEERGELTENYDMVVKADYTARRQEAEEYSQRRLAFMMPKLKSGSHPDNDAKFWDGWIEKTVPEPPGDVTLNHWFSRNIWAVVLLNGFILIIAPLLLTYFCWRKWTQYKKARLAS